MKVGTIFDHPIEGTDKTVKLIAIPDREEGGCKGCIFAFDGGDCYSKLLGRRDCTITGSCTQEESIIYKLLEDHSPSASPETESLIFSYLSENKVPALPLEEGFKAIEVEGRMFVDITIQSILTEEGSVRVFLEYKEAPYQINIPLIDLISFVFAKLRQINTHRFI